MKGPTSTTHHTSKNLLLNRLVHILKALQELES